MKRVYQKHLLWLLVIAVLSSAFFIPYANATEEQWNHIQQWELMWGNPPNDLAGVMNDSPSHHWITLKSGEAIPKKPKEVSTAWIRIKLPSNIPKDYGMYIPSIYAQHLSVYAGDHLVQEFKFNVPYDQQSSLFPLNSEDGETTVYLKLETSLDRLGILSDIQLNHYAGLLRSYVLRDVEDIILGSSFLFISIIMLISAAFLRKNQKTDLILLSILFLTLGLIIATSSFFVNVNFMRYGLLYNVLFDVSLAIFLPTLTICYERIFQSRKFKWISWFKKFQVIYSVFIIFLMLVEFLFGLFNNVYFFFSVTILGIVMIIQFILIVGSSIILVLERNKEAIIFSSGFASFACMSTVDLVRYYASFQKYQMHLWKWGVLGFTLALVIILCKRFSANYDKILNYSKELEFYNHQLQQSEKMEIISELAASIAHEVRNPLQVTRGFLQLVSSRADEKSREYMKIAINELDRASVIITDFLTFSKPQGESVAELNLSKEFSQIEGIILPLVALHSGRITIDVPDHLRIQGNSSKLKQVLINLIKNSIEAFQDDGIVDIWAYTKKDEVFIHIKDNGEGIEAAHLAKLGEPYYSTKMKGTGLGLMVSFQIVGNMKGHLAFKSQKNVGTEVILRFPSFTDK